MIKFDILQFQHNRISSFFLLLAPFYNDNLVKQTVDQKKGEKKLMPGMSLMMMVNVNDNGNGLELIRLKTTFSTIDSQYKLEKKQIEAEISRLNKTSNLRKKNK